MSKLFFTVLFLCLVQLTFSQKVAELKARRFQAEIGKTPNPVIIDVRSASSFEKEHLEDAINIPFRSDSFEIKTALLDTSRTYFVYCAGGVTSVAAINNMQPRGFRKAYSLKGGIMSWKAKGMPVEKQEQSPTMFYSQGALP